MEDAGRLWPCGVAVKFRGETQHPHTKTAGQHSQSYIKWTHPFWRHWTAFPASSTLPGQMLVANLPSLRLLFLLAPQCLLPFSHTDIKGDSVSLFLSPVPGWETSKISKLRMNSNQYLRFLVIRLHLTLGESALSTSKDSKRRKKRPELSENVLPRRLRTHHFIL